MLITLLTLLFLLEHLLDLCRKLCGLLVFLHSVSTCFVLFEVTVLLFLCFSSKSFFIKSATSSLVIKFACFIFSSDIVLENLLN